MIGRVFMELTPRFKGLAWSNTPTEKETASSGYAGHAVNNLMLDRSRSDRSAVVSRDLWWSTAMTAIGQLRKRSCAGEDCCHRWNTVDDY